MSKSKRKAPAKRRPAKPRTTQALARRVEPQGLQLIVHDPAGRLPVATAADGPQALTTLAENAAVGGLGLVEVKLSKAETKILSRPVLATDVQIKPTGQPYLSHPTYTRWLNEALGIGSWALVASGMPKKAESSVVVPYVLYVHGKPIAFAWGEQEYHENNREQTYGDAVESTVASALRRCCKRLGIGLELWDRHWLRAWRDEFAIKVAVKYRRWDRAAHGYKEVEGEWWRRKDAAPFDEEQGVTTNTRRAERMDTTTTTRRAPAAAGYDGHGDDVITEGQVKRLHTIASNAGRKNSEVKSWLAVAYNVSSSKDIKRRDYETICSAIERRGPLPEPAETPDREPGEEG